jgi:hypothetical protein
MPVMRVRTPIVTTTAVSGSPRSKRRITQRSMPAPMKNETSTDRRIATISGTPKPVNHHAMYADSTAMPPCAKLISPVVWFTSTIARARAAYTDPIESPSTTSWTKVPIGQPPR